MQQILIDYSAYQGVDVHPDEPLIDNVLTDGALIDAFYDCGLFTEYTLDFGGGVSGITCRSVIIMSEANPDKLCSMLGLKLTRPNKSMCHVILDECERQILNSSFLI